MMIQNVSIGFNVVLSFIAIFRNPVIIFIFILRHKGTASTIVLIQCMP
jgi:hypothetical protein